MSLARTLAAGRKAHRWGGYASGAERERAQELRLLERGGAIADLHEQVTLEVQPPNCKRITWRVDFAYIEIHDKTHRQVYEDAKYGALTEPVAIKAKLAAARYPDAVIRFAHRQRRGGFVIRDEHQNCR